MLPPHAAAEGALYRLAMRDGRPAAEAELLLDSLQYANGLVLDEARGTLYLSETMGRRVLRYRVDVETGELGDRTVLLDDVFPDNLEMDGAGNLWVAGPVGNEVVVVDAVTGNHRTVFQVQTPEQKAIVDEVVRRVEAGEPCLAVLTPATWAPLPGFITGMILDPDGGPAYLTTLGNALVRLDPAGRASAP